MKNILPLFLVPLIIGFIIQIIKVIIDFFEEKKFHIENFWRAGGFPSVHSGLSSSITTLMLLEKGFYSTEFSICIIFSILFWYDAMNIRYEAGKHAKIINQINIELKDILNFSASHNLKERLGHTFKEVIGGIIIGCILTLLFYFVFNNLI